jgi:hypothetical protein
MSPKIRLVSALLVIAVLASGSLGARPLVPHQRISESDGVLTAIVEWFVSLFTPDRPTEPVHRRTQTKAGSQMDPNGGPG